MHIARGSGFIRRPHKLFPILNQKLARKKARLHRIVRKGLAPPSDKASLRKLAADACASHHIRRIP